MSTSPSLDDDATPLSIEPVLGWRAWQLALTPDGPRLRSLYQQVLWPPGQAMEATCPRRHPAAGTPDGACTCGLYATSTPEALGKAGVFGPAIGVVGAIAMWGRVIEHTRGARSRFAYPARIRLACGRCLVSGLGTGDPVSVVEGREGVAVVCRFHRASVLGVTRPAALVQSELLAAYGVDLLPPEGAADAFRPRVTVAGARVPVPTTPAAVAHTLVDCFARVALFLIKAALALFALGFVLALLGALLGTVVGRSTGSQPIPSPTATAPLGTAPVVLSSSPTEDDEALRGINQEQKPRIVAFAAVCGSGHWDHIRIVRCQLPSAHLFGFASLETPHGPQQDCITPYVAYTRGHHYWICWGAPLGSAPLTPWARAPNPWSIPFAKGGAIR